VNINLNCINTFTSIYRVEPDAVAFCPYRVCPLGAHVDHNFGKITGLAIDKGIHIAYKPKQNGVVELVSLQFEKEHSFILNLFRK
jgi:galactokinase